MATRGVGVQSVILAAGAFVVGLVAGGFGPRGEVRELEQKVFELEKTRSRGGSEAGVELAKLISKGIDGRSGTSPAEGDEAGGAVASAGPAPGGGGGLPTPGDTDALGDVDAEKDPIAAAKELLELRRTQARAALVEDADPTGVQLDEIDRVFSQMNAELEQIARSFVDEVDQGVEPSRREVMASGADALAVMAGAEDQLLNVLTPEQRATVREEATDPMSYVDPRVLGILAPLAPSSQAAQAPQAPQPR